MNINEQPGLGSNVRVITHVLELYKCQICGLVIGPLVANFAGSRCIFEHKRNIHNRNCHSKLPFISDSRIIIFTTQIEL